MILAKVNVTSNKGIGVYQIIKFSDVVYVAKCFFGSIELCNHLEDVTYIDNNKFVMKENVSPNQVNPDTEKVFEFIFESQTDYDYCKSVSTECLTICELNLSLNSIVRDVYFSGIKSITSTKKSIIMCQELVKLFSNSKMNI